MKKIISAFLVVFLCSQFGFSQDTKTDKMKWWDEAKFGMFIHWGVYSDLAGVWNGGRVSGYSEHIFRSKEIPLETYKKQVAANFNPTKFNAEEWVKLCKEAGMKYLVITSKHHDGFAMWDTQVKGWKNYDIVDGTKFKRDPMLELKAACDKYGIKFGFYYSHAQDWSHKYGQRNTWDFNHPTVRGKWYDMPEWQEHRKNSIKYVKEKSIPQLKEILSKKYDPDIIWFDTHNWLPEDYLETILAEARKVADPKVIFNSRSAAGYADYTSTTDKPTEFRPTDNRYWEAIPTTNESYGYHKMDLSHKPASHFITLLSKAAARGGNLLMNIGPKGDGTIDTTDISILKGIGNWLNTNGEAVYGTKKTPLPVQYWGETSVNKDILYLHIHNYPKGSLILSGLKNDIEKAYMLADSKRKPLKVTRLASGDYTIILPDNKPDEIVSIVKLECIDNIEFNGKDRLISASQTNTFHAFDGKLFGSTIEFGSGKAKLDVVEGWKNKSDYITWNARIEEETDFKVFISYNSDEGSKNNQYEICIGDKHLKANVVPFANFKKLYIGTVSLTKGNGSISVKPLNIESNGLMKLQQVILEPIK